jgi:hypothetical protein
LVSVVAVLFSFQGIAMLVPYAQECRSAHETAGWPKTSGQVISARTQDAANSYFKVRVEILYRYQIGEAVFHSSQFYPPPIQRLWRPDQARQLLKEFSTGREVPVYYSPTNPQKAVLKPGVSQDHVAALGALACWVLAPVGLVSWYWLKRRGKSPVAAKTVLR